jgi:hypothetical protein
MEDIHKWLEKNKDFIKRDKRFDQKRIRKNLLFLN